MYLKYKYKIHFLKVFQIQNTKYMKVFKIRISNTCISNTPQHCTTLVRNENIVGYKEVSFLFVVILFLNLD